MTENNKKKEFSWLFYLVIFSVIALVIVVLFRLLTPKETVIQKTEFITTNNKNETTKFSGLAFIGEPIEVPKKLPILVVKPDTSTAETIKNNFISQFKLKQHPQLTTLWSSDVYSLSYNKTDHSYTFFDKTYKTGDEDLYLTGTNKSIEVASNFVKDVLQNLTVSPEKDNVVYLSGLIELYPTENKNKANALMIPFNYNYNGVSIYTTKTPGSLLEITVNAKDEIKKVVFKEDIINFSPSEKNISLIEIPDAINNINASNALILNSYSDDGLPFSISEIAYGDLSTIKLEYRADLKNGIAYPFYHFSGELTNQENKKFKAEIITPAVKVIE